MGTCGAADGAVLVWSPSHPRGREALKIPREIPRLLSLGLGPVQAVGCRGRVA